MGVFGCPDEQGEVRMTTQEVSGEVDGGRTRRIEGTNDGGSGISAEAEACAYSVAVR